MVKKTTQAAADSGEKQDGAPSREKKLYDVSFYLDWCKGCGICMAFCPQEIIGSDKNGKPIMEEPDRCIGCRFCEIHCPDFAITVSSRKPKRRKDDV